MNSGRRAVSRVVMLALFMMALLLGISALQAQTKQFIGWLDELNYLQNASSDEIVQQLPVIKQIRSGIESWLQYHPSSKVELKAAPAEPWGPEGTRRQVATLRETVEAILKEDPNRPFNLGSTTVSVTSESSPLSTIADTFDRLEIQSKQALNAAEALNYIPGVAMDSMVGGRNEASIRLRGFSSKGQIPLYIDGIPVTMPYDGRIDYGRFLSGDIAEMQVSKGFSSPLLGANAMGGSVNLVTRQPERKFQGDVLMGTGSGDMLLSSVNLGTRLKKFYLQAGFDWLQKDFVPLSGNYPLNHTWQQNYELNRSYTQDAKYSGRIAYTPKGQDEYVFSYTNQKSNKGIPQYAGRNDNASISRYGYRSWPYWNKTGYYLITNTGLGESSSIKFRGYYDQFQNAMNFFNYDTKSQTYRYGSVFNTSADDDHSAGGSTEFTTRFLPRNTLAASLVFRDDNHERTQIYPGVRITPTPLDRAQTWSLGFQDIITITSRLRATFGFSADYLNGIKAEELTKAEDAVVAVRCKAFPNNTDPKACTPSVWNYNPQASLSYTISSLDTVFVTFSDRGRFPLLTDLYSYSLGKSITNPELKPEHNRSWNIGYTHAFPAKTVAQIEYFHNHLRDAIQTIYVYDSETDPLCTNTGAIAGRCGQNANVGKEIHQGVEMSIRSNPHPRLTMDVSYSYLNRNIDYDFGDRTDIDRGLSAALILPVYPKNKVIFNMGIKLPHDIMGLATFRYEGGIYLQDTTYKPAPITSTSFGVADLGIMAPIYAGFSVQAGVKNVADRDYYYSAGYPEAGRNWYFNGRYRF